MRAPLRRWTHFEGYNHFFCGTSNNPNNNPAYIAQVPSFSPRELHEVIVALAYTPAAACMIPEHPLVKYHWNQAEQPCSRRWLTAERPRPRRCTHADNAALLVRRCAMC